MELILVREEKKREERQLASEPGGVGWMGARRHKRTKAEKDQVACVASGRVAWIDGCRTPDVTRRRRPPCLVLHAAAHLALHPSHSTLGNTVTEIENTICKIDASFNSEAHRLQ
jgi:hypothetical protein